MAFFLLWILSPVVVGFIASKRGRNGLAWALLTMVLSYNHFYKWYLLLGTEHLVRMILLLSERFPHVWLQIRLMTLVYQSTLTWAEV